MFKKHKKYMRCNVRSLRIRFIIALLGAMIGFFVGFAYTYSQRKVPKLIHGRSVEVRFSQQDNSPNKSNCVDLLVDLIDSAQEDIYLQLYEFNLVRPAQALLRAIDRGVKVCIALDKGRYEKNYHKHPIPEIEDLKTKADYMAIYDSSKQAHDKISTIDRKYTTTGSFNWTGSAQQRNAENLMLIRNGRQAAQADIDHFFKGKKNHTKIKDFDQKLSAKNKNIKPSKSSKNAKKR